MKTRIIYTKFWYDNYISTLTHKEKLAFLYFITNEKVNICGIYELPDKYIKVDLDITQEELDRIKEKFMKDNKFMFIDGWIKIINFKLYNKFEGEKNESAKEKELSLIPKKVIEYTYSMDRVSDFDDTLNNHKSIIINHKSLINKGGIVKGGDNGKEINANIILINDDINSQTKTETKNISIPVEEIISYLNEKAGTNYKPTTKKTISLIKARFNEGFNIDDFKVVIDKKTIDWQNTEFEKFLRPETLFGTKFESYLNEKPSNKDYKKTSYIKSNYEKTYIKG